MRLNFMNSKYIFSGTFHKVVLTGLVVFLTACGQKGPLYLPATETDNETQNVTSPILNEKDTNDTDNIGQNDDENNY